MTNSCENKNNNKPKNVSARLLTVYVPLCLYFIAYVFLSFYFVFYTAMKAAFCL